MVAVVLKNKEKNKNKTKQKKFIFFHFYAIFHQPNNETKISTSSQITKSSQSKLELFFQTRFWKRESAWVSKWVKSMDKHHG